MKSEYINVKGSCQDIVEARMSRCECACKTEGRNEVKNYKKYKVNSKSGIVTLIETAMIVVGIVFVACICLAIMSDSPYRYYYRRWWY